MCVVSLEQEIIRFKPQKRRIKGGRGGRWRKKSWCFVQKGRGRVGVNRWKEREEQSPSGLRKDSTRENRKFVESGGNTEREE